MAEATSRSAQEAIASAVVRISSQDGVVCGAGALVAADLVLTCAHVVSDALALSRQEEVAPGATVMVDLPLAERTTEGAVQRTAQVVRWVPIRPDRTGDVALLRLESDVPDASPLPVADPDDVWGHDARAVGFVDGEPTALWFRGRFSGTTEEGWLQLSRADGQSAFARKGFSGSPVWDNALDAVVGLVVAAQQERDPQQVFALRTRTLLREIPELDAVLSPSEPFRGLTSLREENADVFFGRDDDIDTVFSALRGDHPAVTVYGPSGCGKSSLVLAGVVPKMRENGYEVLVVDAGRSGSHQAALATELFEVVRSGRYGSARADRADHDQIERWLDELGLADAFHRATGQQRKRLLVVLDQAEALLDLSEPELRQTVALLFPERAPEGLRVVATLRADFMDAMLSHTQLGPVLRRAVTLPITPMTRDQLHAVITEPLRLVPAVEYDPGLDRRILDDAGDGPGTLPLLSFVLEQLWRDRAAGRLRAATYDRIGGVPGALSKHADDAWRACVRPEAEAEARLLLMGLVRVLPGGEAPIRHVLTRKEAGEERWRLARALAEWRLLVLSGGDGRPESAELAHEALISAWPTLAEEVRRSAEFLAGRAEVQHDLERWRKADCPPELLPGALQLTALQVRLRGRETDLTAQQREFLDQAHQRHKKQRARVRTGWVSAALVLALIAALATFLVQQSNVSEQRAAEGLSRTLAIRSDELMETNPGQAALAALAAYETSPTQESRSALMRRYEAFQDAAWTLTGAEGPIRGADTSADGTVTLVTTEGGRATLFVRTAEGGVRQEQLSLSANVMSPVVSRDGRRIAYMHDEDLSVTWHEVTLSRERLVGPANPLQGAFDLVSLGIYSDLKVMDFSPDARRLVLAPPVDSGLSPRVWDLEAGGLQALPNGISHLSEVWFGQDEDTLVALRQSDPELLTLSVVVVDIASGTMREIASGVSRQGTSVSGDGSVVIVCDDSSGEGTYQAVRVMDGRVLRRYERGPDSNCTDVSITEKGERFAVYSAAPDEWDLIEVSRPQDQPTSFLSPPYVASNSLLALLGTAREPVIVSQDGSTVTGWALAENAGGTAYSPPVLLDNGTMVARTGMEGDRLVLMETEGREEVISEIGTDASVPADATQPLQVNSSETLVADVSNLNRITVRALPSLHQVAEFTTPRPPVSDDGTQQLLWFDFLDGDQLLTVSGTLIEHWDARSGRRLSPPLDLSDLGLTAEEAPIYHVRPHREPGYLAVTVQGKPHAHAVDLATGRVNEDLRLQLGDGLTVVVFLDDPHYAAAMTTGGMVELWSVPPGQSPQRIAGPLGPLNPNRWVVGSTGDAGFFIANDSSVQFLRADDPEYRETFQFAEPQGFLSASSDGRVLLRTPVSGGQIKVLRLDAALWQRHLCAVVGRDFTADELAALPTDTPTEICP
ncbi:serine protease [Nocardiopsis dassonvillei]|uniref:nSTAND1 domain-containing NTPase n=1 Tax=Nocardiopsis dassonvillei TaxID=2014 RepID=UPI00200D5CDE|nr:serine protease [Nocardiopsis dassonvillei]MCK9868697.1 serine protease [Nocardiopsis dassonvillei]